MDRGTGKVLVVEADEAVRQRVVTVLGEAGYEVSGECPEGMKTVLAFDPDAVVLGAEPPELDCCDLLSEIKGTERTRTIRVIVLAHGGPAARARGMDLGADDVLSLPFDSHELLSRVRWQLRDKAIADGLRERQALARQVATAVDEERKTLRIGVLAAVAVLIAGGLALLFFYRRGQEQNVRVYAAITRLQSGMATQQRLERSRQTIDVAGGDRSQTADQRKLALVKKSEDLKSQIAASGAEGKSDLEKELGEVEGRLQKLESEGQNAQTIIESYEPSVCLIHVELGFHDHASGAVLRYANVTSSGEPATDEHNNALVSVGGSGPPVHVDVFGTGFLAAGSGQILTNHHVAEPWWQSDDLKEMLSQGLDPVVDEMSAYFPGVSHGIAVATEKISADADVALLKGKLAESGIKEVALADGRGGAVRGRPVVLLGYPTALDAILARAGAETLDSIASASNGDSKQMLEELARRHLIRPIATQGHIGDVLGDKIVYDAQTTTGGSGGPLFNDQGKVIGINFAMVRQFGGSNFAIPVGYGKTLLKP